MKTAKYDLVGGGIRTVEYDENEPCWMCNNPVCEASMGGTVICPSCDCGYTRNGRQWTFEETLKAYELFREKKTMRLSPIPKTEWVLVESCDIKTKAEVRDLYIGGLLKEKLLRLPDTNEWLSPIDLLSRQLDRAVGIIE
jgi:hypothetical protein